jgi:hypothetical protein
MSNETTDQTRGGTSNEISGSIVRNIYQDIKIGILNHFSAVKYCIFI